MTAAAIYVRVSSEMQLDGHSLEAQERLCREYCQRHGLAITTVYREEAESASSNDRPELQRMLADARAHVFAAIVFYHTWRFSRSIEDSALMTRLERSGIRLMSVTDAIDSATPAGRLQRNITLAVGQHYLDQLRAETTRGKRERALQGYSNASHPPFGYVRVSDRQNAPGPEAAAARSTPSGSIGWTAWDVETPRRSSVTKPGAPACAWSSIRPGRMRTPPRA